MSGLGGLGSGMGNMEDALSINPEAFAKAIQMNMNEDDLSELMMSLLSSENSSYDGNLKKLGYADLNVPGGINIYPKDFESKSEIVGILDQYNADMEAAGEDEKVITYTDLVGTLMSSVTNIVNIISYVLVAFVAISLVVSSIMIGVITYIMCSGEEKRNWYSKSDWCFQAQRVTGVQCGDVYYRILRRCYGDWNYIASSHSCEQHYPVTG